jgi:Tol biopolymer transport system component
MLRECALAAAAAIGVLCDALPSRFEFTWLTVPQRDGRRSPSSVASARVSSDGGHVVFTSYAPLVAADVDTLADIYVLDRSTTTVTLESAVVDGRPLNSDVGHPGISADGRYVVFEAVMSDDPVRIVTEVVLRDRLENTARRITIGLGGVLSNGWSGQPVIVADGSAVIFASAATNLTAGPDLNGAQPDIYRFDRAVNLTERISLDSRGVQHPGGSLMPSVSGDGRYVAFSSTAALANPRTASAQQPQQGRRPTIYLREMRDRQTVLVGGAAELPNDVSTTPVVSADGRSVGFVSRASNLVARDRNKSSDVFLYDVESGAITLVSRGRTGATANGTSLSPAVSADGRLVAFQSDASDLACARNCPPGMEDINLLPDVFLFDRTTGQISCVSLDRQGTWMEESGGPALDASGAVVAFTSRHPISPRDALNDFDLFVRILSR